MSAILDFLAEGGAGGSLTSGSVTIAAGCRASGTGQVLGRVTASGKFTALNPYATDGSGVAAGVLADVGFSSQLAVDTPQIVVTAGLVRRAAIQYGLGFADTRGAALGLVALGVIRTIGSAAE